MAPNRTRKVGNWQQNVPGLTTKCEKGWELRRVALTIDSSEIEKVSVPTRPEVSARAEWAHHVPS